MSPEERARLWWLADAKSAGVEAADREEYAQVGSETFFGRFLVLSFALQDLRDAVLAPFDRAVVWLVDRLDRRG